ncbi:hypothetical protein A5636_18285 [Mycobacterium asiaticum]|uniref:Uncharacterized protein n=1 Tax=Mycobacterium asiaticum TaxID=1790 RepID=A0A1A3NG25_MYCAS|nr:hypothetical protein A5636_18285 [Mycobacterium asiaticum]
MSTITENLDMTSTFPPIRAGRASSNSTEDILARLLALQRWESEGGAVHSAAEIIAGEHSGWR